ncbi:hypothetical protein B296_00021241 [Ensete ventricosum]|uniref:Uncharacterized protein n=1 Tax=Ensete ventricosum TaxID=4639 RepID=A0A427A348_ENSVE|nr:hypothetical protein B296_00021241 [Ensete ventricosum]
MRRCLVPVPGRRGVVVPFSFLASSPRAGRRKLIDEESPMGDGSRGRFFALKQQIARGTREDQVSPSFLPFLLLPLLLSPSINHRRSKSTADDRNRPLMADFGGTVWDVYIFIPEPGNTKAIIAVSALAKAMKEMNKSAVLRCRFYQFLHLKSKAPEIDVPQLDRSLKRIKLPREAWREKPSASNDEKVGVDGKKSSSSLEIKPSELTRQSARYNRSTRSSRIDSTFWYKRPKRGSGVLRKPGDERALELSLPTSPADSPPLGRCRKPPPLVGNVLPELDTNRDIKKKKKYQQYKLMKMRKRFFSDPSNQQMWLKSQSSRLQSSNLEEEEEEEEEEKEMRQRTSSKRDSSQGRATGPERDGKPYSSSAWRSSCRNTGWLRWVTRTTNRRELLPTHIATCPNGTSDGAAHPLLLVDDDVIAVTLHRPRICRSHATCLSLLHLPPIASSLLSPSALLEREG